MNLICPQNSPASKSSRQTHLLIINVCMHKFKYIQMRTYSMNMYIDIYKYTFMCMISCLKSVDLADSSVGLHIYIFYKCVCTNSFTYTCIHIYRHTHVYINVCYILTQNGPASRCSRYPYMYIINVYIYTRICTS